MSAKTNLTLDAIILAAFLIAFEPALTGIAIHEWLSLAFAGALLIHILLHWDWVAKVTLQFFRKLFHASRLNYLVDAALLIAFVAVMLSGFVVSRSIFPFLGLRVEAGSVWRVLHSSSADATVLLVGLHFALHWKWIINMLKRYLWTPLKRRLAPRRLQPQAALSTPMRVNQDEIV